MPLATNIEITKAKLLEDSRQLASLASAQTRVLNQQTQRLLALPNGELTEFLQGQGADLPALLDAHKQACDAANLALSLANATLQAAGQPTMPGQADGSPFADKLAAKGKAIDMQTLTVSDA